jgi:hypothetical protein
METILRAYIARGLNHAATVEAANDSRLSIDFLLGRALAHIKTATDDRKDPLNYALLILQQRTTDEVYNRAIGLLQRDDPAKRMLGVQILREFPGLSAPHPHSPKTILALKVLIDKEKDIEVLAWAISAVAWQRHPDGIETLLRFTNDRRVRIRKTVAWNLYMPFENEEALPTEITDAYLTLASDVCSDIRWSVFYDIAEWPSFFRLRIDDFVGACTAGIRDSCERVQEKARKALTPSFPVRGFDLGVS